MVFEFDGNKMKTYDASGNLKAEGTFSFTHEKPGLESVQHRYLDGRAVMNCGEATAAEIDKEVMEMLKKAYDEAKSLLTENREALDKIAAFLIEKETITGKEFMKIFREVKEIPEPDESQEKKEDRIVMKPTEDAEVDNTDETEDAEA